MPAIYLISLAVFLGVVLTLVGILLLVESRLTVKGDQRIVINGDENKSVSTPGGKTLLGALIENRIYLPSACGGKGTCGTCKCKVVEGGGDILPTELSLVSRKGARRADSPGLPGQGQAGYGHPHTGRDFQHPEVHRHRGLQRQRGHLHQGACHQTGPRPDDPIQSRGVHADRHPRIRGRFQGFQRGREVQGGMEAVQPA